VVRCRLERICLISTGLIILPICLIIGAPLLGVGRASGKFSPAYSVPLCPAGEGLYVSMNLTNTQQCPQNLTSGTNVSFNISPSSGLYTDFHYNILVYRPQAANEAQMTMYFQNSVGYNRTQIQHIDLKPLPDSGKLTTPYGTSQANVLKSGETLKIYSNQLDSPCNSTGGCDFRVTENLGTDSITAQEITAGKLILNIDNLVITSQTTPVIYFRLQKTGIYGIELAGAIILGLPLALILSPCLYCLGLVFGSSRTGYTRH